MTRTLRLFLSHTVSGQSWQTGDASAEATVPNFETGEGVPAWQFKLEGRLIEVRLLSSLFASIGTDTTV